MDIQIGDRVKTKELKENAGGMYIPSQDLKNARKSGVTGTVKDLDWTYAFEKVYVEHDDGTVAIYLEEELELLEE